MDRLDARRTAVLTLDVQNDLVAITPGLTANRTLENIAAILKAARAKKAEVIHITASARKDFRDIPAHQPLWIGIKKAKLMIRGTKGAELHPKSRALKSELVMNKTCVDPFLTTNLAQALINAGADNLVLTGLWTNYVVEAAARHASDLGYRVVVVRDACASNTEDNHAFAVDVLLPTICEVGDTKDVVKALR